MKAQSREEVIKQICDFMGEDLDGEACKEVQEHISACPTCKVYFDTVKKTVTLCRENDADEKIPDDVNERLFKVLKLEDLQKK